MTDAPPPPQSKDLAPASVAAPRGKSESLALLASAARCGELPEFSDGCAHGDFSVAAFSEPLDHEMIGSFEEQDGLSMLRFSVRMRRRIPIAFWVLSALAVWPGVQLTHSMLTIYFPGYRYATWMWYLPITILPLPWVWASVTKKSRARARASAQEMRDRIARILGDVSTP